MNLKTLKRKLLNRWKVFLIPNQITSLREVEEWRPVFILGANRSGTSVVSSLMSQHPELEGLFDQGPAPDRTASAGHTPGFNESNHIWSWLITDETIQVQHFNEGVLWGHPKFISGIYRDRPYSDQEALDLVNAVQYYRKTTRMPLIKDPFNTLRIGLIRTIFPRAKFILVVRNYPDYIESCFHKWFDNAGALQPSIGLHWLTINTLACYELEKFAPGDYAVFHYKHLFDQGMDLNGYLHDIVNQLGLAGHDFDTGFISREQRYLVREMSKEDMDFNPVSDLQRYERDMYR